MECRATFAYLLMCFVPQFTEATDIITLESVIFPICLSFAYATLLILTLDQELNLSEHVNLITRSCYYQLRQLRVVMRSLSHDAAVVLVHVFVTSRIDHSCSVLVGLPLGLIGRRDRVVRSAAHLICHIPKYASVSAYILHWLPVSQRILYRI